MADISAEIAAFQNAVYGEDVRSAMVSLANKVNDAVVNGVNSISDAVNIVTGYDYRLTNAQSQIDLIKESACKKFKNKKISIIGDSISTYDDPDYKINGYVMFYPRADVTDVNSTWWKKLADISGATIEVNASYAGSGATTIENAPSFYSRCNILGAPDIIFVVLGVNDQNKFVSLGEYDYDTEYTDLSEIEFIPAYIKGIKALQNNYSNASIICVSLNNGETYITPVRNISATLGCDFIHISDYSKAITLHPSKLGMNQIASHILNNNYEISNALIGENLVPYKNLKDRLDTETVSNRLYIDRCNTPVRYLNEMPVPGSPVGAALTTQAHIPIFYRVVNGDILKTNMFLNSDSRPVQCNIWKYDKQFKRIGISNWMTFTQERTFTIDFDGFIKINFSHDSESYTDVIYTNIIYLEYINDQFINALDMSYGKWNEFDRVFNQTIDKNNLFSYDINNGNPILSELRCSSGFIKVYKDSIIVPTTPFIGYYIAKYDLLKNYIEKIEVEKRPFYVDETCFIRIIVKNNTSFYPTFASLPNILFNLIAPEKSNYAYLENVIDITNYYTTTVDDLTVGSYTSNTKNSRTDRFYINKYFAVHKGDIIKINYDWIQVAYMYFDIYGNSSNYSPWHMRHYKLNSNNVIGDCIIPMDGLISINMAIIDRSTYNMVSDVTDLISEYDGIVTIYRANNNLNLIDYYSPMKKINRKFRSISGISIHQDGCFIGDNLWSFSDGNGYLGNIDIINIDTGVVISQKQHNLGHANSVSYNAKVDTLATYGTNGNNMPTIVLYKNPQVTNTLQLSDSNCIIIPLYNTTTHMNITAGLCFGEDESIIYYVEGCSNSKESLNNTIFDSKNDIYKIKLGMGSKNYSNDGYGTFISGKNDDEYNGTCKILKVYHGEIREGTHTKSLSGSYPTTQGVDFDGYLYVGWGTSGHNFLKIELLEDLDAYRVVDNYWHSFYDSDDNEIHYEPELLALKNNKIYCGSLNPNIGSVLLEFNL